MLINLLFFILSIVPSVLIIVRLRNRKKNDPLYLQSCKSAIIRGLVCVLPILVVSATFHLVRNLLIRFVFPDMNPLVSQAIYTFIVLAFSEELVKYFMFRRVLSKNADNFSMADITAFMVIIGTAFGLVEDIPYAIGATPVIMIIRGFTMGHVGYGFLMGWLYGKRIKTGKKIYGIAAFGLPFLIHGLYDFSLSEELLKLNDNLAFIGISLALLDIVLLILMVRFFLVSRKKESGIVQLSEKAVEVNP
ncbi:MAG: PrsW family intramembrane metalloprotease [Clostridiales bacterium]|nr:PrsW family intramembrane metalloprotease [Clostridiales bacterium]